MPNWAVLQSYSSFPIFLSCTAYSKSSITTCFFCVVLPALAKSANWGIWTGKYGLYLCTHLVEFNPKWKIHKCPYYVLDKIILDRLITSLTWKDLKVGPEYMYRYHFTSCWNTAISWVENNSCLVMHSKTGKTVDSEVNNTSWRFTSMWKCFVHCNGGLLSSYAFDPFLLVEVLVSAAESQF